MDSALAIGLGAIGAIPEAGGVARAFGHQAGYVGVVADQSDAKLLHAVDHAKDIVTGLTDAWVIAKAIGRCY
jgi:hypothetical protein